MNKVMLLIIGCLAFSASQAASVQDIQMNMLGEKFVKERLNDADSAKFRNQFVGKKGFPCGEVNAKNQFGGYTGFKRYMSAGKEMTIFESDMAPGEFNKSWAMFCK